MWWLVYQYLTIRINLLILADITRYRCITLGFMGETDAYLLYERSEQCLVDTRPTS